MLRLLVISLTIFYSLALSAKLKGYNFSIVDPFLASTWGYIAVGSQEIDTKSFKQQLLKIKAPHYFKKEISVLVNQQPTSAPLAVFIPGSFCSKDRRQPRQIAKILLAKGYAVVRLPNPLSLDYLAAHPQHQLANFMQSSNSLLTVIKKVRQQLIQQKITTSQQKIILIGVSHGAFLAAVMASKQGTLFKKVLLFSPPINILSSTKALDNIIDKNSTRISLSQLTLDLLSLTKLYFKSELRADEEYKFAPMAKDLITFATFQQRLLFSVDKFFENQNKPSPFPYFWNHFLSSAYWKWRSRVKLIPILQHYAPNSWKLYNQLPLNTLHFWSEQVHKAHIPLVILSAKDDFINQNEQWQESSYLQLIPHGSHYGYRNQQWFVEFIQQQL